MDRKYAELLASQGFLDVALSFLSLCSADTVCMTRTFGHQQPRPCLTLCHTQAELAVQRDRVFNARLDAQPGEVAPAFPFEAEAVLTQAQITAHAHAQHMQQQQQVSICQWRARLL